MSLVSTYVHACVCIHIHTCIHTYIVFTNYIKYCVIIVSIVLFVNESTCPGALRHKLFGISRGSPRSQYLFIFIQLMIIVIGCIED